MELRPYLLRGIACFKTLMRGEIIIEIYRRRVHCFPVTDNRSTGVGVCECDIALLYLRRNDMTMHRRCFAFNQ